MAEFEVVISDPKDGNSYQREVDGQHANRIIGKLIGDEVDGIFVGLPGYKLQITGGSDIDGFPMKNNIPGPGRKKVLGKGGVGFRSQGQGVRKKKTVRGNTVSDQLNQINLKVIEHGPKEIPKLFEEEEEEGEGEE
ncbi:MAG: 30S ribosomal protein S6e [Candidatus Thermoplasmatota archaeon]|nr:30S ribosomal protein S6e [Candidatus Thermoplasmatota archaeon]